MKRLAFALLASVSLSALAMAQEVPALQPTASASSQATREVASAQATATTGAMPTETAPGQAAAMTVPRTMPPPIPLHSPDRALPRKAALGLSIATRWRNRYAKPAIGADGV